MTLSSSVSSLDLTGTSFESFWMKMNSNWSCMNWQLARNQIVLFVLLGFSVLLHLTSRGMNPRPLLWEPIAQQRSFKSCSLKSLFGKNWTKRTPLAVSRASRLWGEVSDIGSSGVRFRARTSRLRLRQSSNFKVPPTGSFLGRTPFRFCCSFLSLTLRSPPSTSSSIEVRGRVQTLGCRTGSGLDDVTGWPFLTDSPLVSLPSGCPLWATSASVGRWVSS